MKSKKFKLTCNKCGSTNVKIKIDEDIVGGGYGYQSEITGKLDIECLDCDEFEYVKQDD